MFRLPIPELALVLLVGPAGSGKSTFAGRHFAPTQVISSDTCRAMVADDEGDQSATRDAFDLLHFVVEKRLRRGRLTVVDATNVDPEARRPLLALARKHHVPAVAIVFDLPLDLCVARDRQRRRSVGREAIERQHQQLRASLPLIGKERFRQIHRFHGEQAVEQARVTLVPLPSNRKQERGPFDVIGDVHGCFDELVALLAKLGWSVEDRGGRFAVRHPEGRRLVFVGDLVDRGPKIPQVLRLAMDAIADGVAYCVAGNHEAKLLRKLQGREVRIGGGLEQTLAQLEHEESAFLERLYAFLSTLPHHLQFDEGRLVVAHGGLPAPMQGRDSPRVQAVALYGETTGGFDESGHPIRRDWAADYHGPATVVFGHTPVEEPVLRNGTANIDTGCVFGGSLTAYRYPEGELVQVKAERAWARLRQGMREVAQRA